MHSQNEDFEHIESLGLDNQGVGVEARQMELETNALQLDKFGSKMA